MTRLTTGDAAPAFELAADDGEIVSSADLAGSRYVLYFYPKDDTPGCTTEVCEFRDSWAAVQRSGAVLLGVSPDGVDSHRKFREKFSLPFPLLADEGHAVADAYGTWGEKSMYGKKYYGVLRTTFIIDPAGSVRRVFEQVKPAGHAAEVLAALSAP